MYEFSISAGSAFRDCASTPFLVCFKNFCIYFSHVYISCIKQYTRLLSNCYTKYFQSDIFAIPERARTYLLACECIGRISQAGMGNDFNSAPPCIEPFSRGSTAPNEGSVKGSRPPHSLRLIRRIDSKKKKKKEELFKLPVGLWAW